MGILNAVVLFTGAVCLLVLVLAAQRSAARAALMARLQFLAKGEVPVRCSWCKVSFLARKAMFIEGKAGVWAPRHVDSLGALEPERQIVALEQLYQGDAPTVQRLCSEKCTREFLSSVGTPEASLQTQFIKCEHCAAKWLVGTSRCNACGSRSLK